MSYSYGPEQRDYTAIVASYADACDDEDVEVACNLDEDCQGYSERYAAILARRRRRVFVLKQRIQVVTMLASVKNNVKHMHKQRLSFTSQTFGNAQAGPAYGCF